VNTETIVAALDQEIARLQQARALLAGGSVVKKRGRPRKDNTPPAWVTSNGLAATAPAPAPARKKRTFSAKQRREQALRMKKYWAAKKKAAKKAA
jgi:hypothetical protein